MSHSFRIGDMVRLHRDRNHDKFGYRGQNVWKYEEGWMQQTASQVRYDEVCIILDEVYLEAPWPGRSGKSEASGTWYQVHNSSATGWFHKNALDPV